MKLVDLNPRRTLRQPHDDIISSYEQKLKKLGSGGYGTTFRIPGPVEKTLKVGEIVAGHRPIDDGYLAWLNAVHDKHNPFYPQVEQVRVHGEYRDPADHRSEEERTQYNYRAKVERLTRGTALSTKEVEQMWMRWYNQPITRLLHTFFMKEADVMKTDYKQAVLTWFARMIQYMVFKGKIKYTTYPPIDPPKVSDQHFREAIHLLQKMIADSYEYDMHSNNIMFRRTPYGPQPVFMDPLE